MAKFFMKNNLDSELNIKEWIRKATEDELTCESILKHRDSKAGTIL